MSDERSSLLGYTNRRISLVTEKGGWSRVMIEVRHAIMATKDGYAGIYLAPRTALVMGNDTARQLTSVFRAA